jgi:hypothetical protein
VSTGASRRGSDPCRTTAVTKLRSGDLDIPLGADLSLCFAVAGSAWPGVTAVLRPAKRPSGREVRAFLRRLLRQLRANWPRVEILLRADSHYCAPEVLRWCRASKVGYLLGVAPTSTLRRHVERLEASTAARFAASDGSAKLRRFTEFHDGAASCWCGRPPAASGVPE